MRIMKPYHHHWHRLPLAGMVGNRGHHHCPVQPVAAPDGALVHPGPTTSDAVAKRVRAPFAAPVQARYVRVQVEAWNVHVSMRVDALVRPLPAPAAVLACVDVPRDERGRRLV